MQNGGSQKASRSTGPSRPCTLGLQQSSVFPSDFRTKKVSIPANWKHCFPISEKLCRSQSQQCEVHYALSGSMFSKWWLQLWCHHPNFRVAHKLYTPDCTNRDTEIAIVFCQKSKPCHVYLIRKWNGERPYSLSFSSYVDTEIFGSSQWATALHPSYTEATLHYTHCLLSWSWATFLDLGFWL